MWQRLVFLEVSFAAWTSFGNHPLAGEASPKMDFPHHGYSAVTGILGPASGKCSYR
jgi:hypothetical protein